MIYIKIVYLPCLFDHRDLYEVWVVIDFYFYECNVVVILYSYDLYHHQVERAMIHLSPVTT